MAVKRTALAGEIELLAGVAALHLTLRGLHGTVCNRWMIGTADLKSLHRKRRVRLGTSDR
jgi:hypothetical protein